MLKYTAVVGNKFKMCKRVRLQEAAGRKQAGVKLTRGMTVVISPGTYLHANKTAFRGSGQNETGDRG